MSAEFNGLIIAYEEVGVHTYTCILCMLGLGIHCAHVKLLCY